jgi:hypothetical protein
MISRTIVIEDTDKTYDKLITSDQEIARMSRGFMQVNEDGEPVGREPIHQVHLLTEGARYRRKMLADEKFENWSRIESRSQEKEVALGVIKSLDAEKKFKYLPNVLKCGDGLRQEWDAVFLDTKEDKLVFVETKHRVTLEDVKKTRDRSDGLPNLLNKVITQDFKAHAKKSIKTVIAGAVFDAGAVDLALAEGLYICYVMHSRYGLPAEDVLKQDIRNRTFILKSSA